MDKKIQNYFFAIVFLLTGALVFFIFIPYLDAIILGLVFAVVFYPIYERINNFLNQKEVWAALIATFILLLLVLAPLIYMGTVIFQEARLLYFNLASQESRLSLLESENLKNFLENFISSSAAERVLNNILENITLYAKEGISWIFKNIGAIFSSTLIIVFNLILSLFAFFYFLKDGKRLKRFLMVLSPLPSRYEEKIIDYLYKAVNSVIRGTLIVAIVQGLLAGIGFAALGIPNASIWGAFAVIAAMIPSLGTALVIVPGAIYLYIFKGIGYAITLLLWGTFVVGTIDNLLRPKLIEKGIHIHPFLILLSVLGGLRLFGAIGFLLGPLALSFFFVLLEIYQEQKVAQE